MLDDCEIQSARRPNGDSGAHLLRAAMWGAIPVAATLGGWLVPATAGAIALWLIGGAGVVMAGARIVEAMNADRSDEAR